MARDSLRYAMSVPADEIEALDGLLVRAFRFLSGYGFYVNVSTDRCVGCILDVLAHGSAPHSMVGPFSSSVFAFGQRFCWQTQSARLCLPFKWSLCLLIAGVTLRHGPRTLVHPAVSLPRHWRRLPLLLMPAARPDGKLLRALPTRSFLFFFSFLSRGRSNPLPAAALSLSRNSANFPRRRSARQVFSLFLPFFLELPAPSQGLFLSCFPSPFKADRISSLGLPMVRLLLRCLLQSLLPQGLHIRPVEVLHISAISTVAGSAVHAC